MSERITHIRQAKPSCNTFGCAGDTTHLQWWHNLHALPQPLLIAQHCCHAEVGAEGDTYSYSYVPGAGDDEESWAQGLTPALFWKHQQVIVITASMVTWYSCNTIELSPGDPAGATSVDVVACCAVLCCAMLCYTMPCSALLCSAMSCYARLGCVCCAVLCCAV